MFDIETGADQLLGIAERQFLRMKDGRQTIRIFAYSTIQEEAQRIVVTEGLDLLRTDYLFRSTASRAHHKEYLAGDDEIEKWRWGTMIWHIQKAAQMCFDDLLSTQYKDTPLPTVVSICEVQILELPSVYELLREAYQRLHTRMEKRIEIAKKEKQNNVELGLNTEKAAAHERTDDPRQKEKPEEGITVHQAVLILYCLYRSTRVVAIANWETTINDFKKFVAVVGNISENKVRTYLVTKGIDVLELGIVTKFTRFPDKWGEDKKVVQDYFRMLKLTSGSGVLLCDKWIDELEGGILFGEHRLDEPN